MIHSSYLMGLSNKLGFQPRTPTTQTLIIIIIIIISSSAADLWSDWIFDADDTEAGQLRDDVLLVFPVRLYFHQELIGTCSTCPTTP